MFKRLKNATIPDMARQFNNAAIAPADCAHLCVDVQKKYTNGTQIPQHIARKIAPAFRNAGIENYWIHLTPKVDNKNEPMVDDNNMPLREYAFSEVSPLPGEMIIAKPRASAFVGTDLHKVLQDKNIKLVIVSGFAFGCCVAETVKSAIEENYQVAVLTDGTYRYGSDDIREELTEKGTLFTDSKNLIAALQARP